MEGGRVSRAYVEAIVTWDDKWLERIGGVINLMGMTYYHFITNSKGNDGVEESWSIFIAIYDIKSEKEYYTRLEFLVEDDIAPWEIVKKGNIIPLYMAADIVAKAEIISEPKIGEFYEGC